MNCTKKEIFWCNSILKSNENLTQDIVNIDLSQRF